MTIAESLANEVLRLGGTLRLEGDKVISRLPDDAMHLVEELRASKLELVELLRRAGGRMAAFPHCPKCASYDLYRENNLGDYECQRCGLRDIEESRARRLM